MSIFFINILSLFVFVFLHVNTYSADQSILHNQTKDLQESAQNLAKRKPEAPTAAYYQQVVHAIQQIIDVTVIKEEHDKWKHRKTVYETLQSIQHGLEKIAIAPQSPKWAFFNQGYIRSLQSLIRCGPKIPYYMYYKKHLNTLYENALQDYANGIIDNTGKAEEYLTRLTQEKNLQYHRCSFIITYRKYLEALSHSKTLRIQLNAYKDLAATYPKGSPAHKKITKQHNKVIQKSMALHKNIPFDSENYDHKGNSSIIRNNSD